MSFLLMDGRLLPWLFLPAFRLAHACLTALPPVLVGIFVGWRMHRAHAWVGVVLAVFVGIATIPVTNASAILIVPCTVPVCGVLLSY